MEGPCRCHTDRHSHIHAPRGSIPGRFAWNSSTFGTSGVGVGQWSGLTTSLPMYTFPFFYEAVGLGLGALGIVLVIDGVVSPTGGTLSQYMGGSTSRVMYGTAKEGYLGGSSFFRVHPKYRVPVVGIITTFIVTIVLLVIAAIGYLVSSVGGAWSALTSIVTTTGVFSYIIGPVALVIFRRAHKDLKRPFVLPGGFALSLVAFIVSALMIYWGGAGGLISSSDPYGGYILLIIILAGFLLYGYAKDKNFSRDIKSGAWVIVLLLFNIVLLYVGEYQRNYLKLPWDWVAEIVVAIGLFFWLTTQRCHRRRQRLPSKGGASA